MNCEVCHQVIYIAHERTNAIGTRHLGCSKLNSMFHIAAGRLVKTSNDEEVPEDEPLFILRGRDRLAALVLIWYRDLCRDNQVPPDRLQLLNEVIQDFKLYQIEHPTKLPGSTHGR